MPEKQAQPSERETPHVIYADSFQTRPWLEAFTPSKREERIQAIRETLKRVG